MNSIHYDVPGQSEDELQQKCVFWFHNTYPSLRGCLFHVPNGGKRNKREAARFKKMGVYPGVGDLILLMERTTTIFELKDEKGRQSKAQKDWEMTMIENGFEYILIRNLSHFKRVVCALTNRSNISSRA